MRFITSQLGKISRVHYILGHAAETLIKVFVEKRHNIHASLLELGLKNVRTEVKKNGKNEEISH